jgi:hypothetical protein
MCKKLFLLISLVLLLGVVGAASAVQVKVDFGGAGTLDATWTEWNAVAGNLTVNGVQFTLSNSNQANGPNLRTGIGDALTKESLGSDDECVGGVFTLNITNLPAGLYNLDTYFNNPTSYGYPWNLGGGQEVWVDGTKQAGPSPASYQQTSENALVLSASLSSSGTSDLITIEWKNSALPSNWINGFELVSQGPQFTFASAGSSGFEYVSPAEVEVTLLNPAEGQTHTVDYAVVGGTATGGGVDYTLAAGTLTFNPGETSKPVSIEIINDGVDEDDETIIVELSNPTGGGAVLGNITQHTYTILDPRPKVGFEAGTSNGREDAGSASVPVSLSFAALHTVTVDYSVTGGTATGGGVDYTLEPDTLTFYPGQSTRWINVAVVDDGLDEGSETIEITLSNLVGGVPGSIMQHTLNLFDPSFLDLKVDLALENPLDSGTPRPATDKSQSDPNWTVWTPIGLGDMYMHDWRGVRDVGGTGIDVSMTIETEGKAGLKCYDMCMANKAGGWPPSGSPVGGPIANTWYTSIDRVSFPQSCVLLAVYNLPVGTYELVGYHNLWEPTSDDSRECTKNGYAHLPMPKVHVWSFEDANDFGQWLSLHYPQYTGQFWDAFGKIKAFAGPPPYGTNVVAIEEDYDVMPSATTNDNDVTKSLVKFWTDGSPVIIMYESAECETSQYRGCRAVLNAFEVKTVPPTFSPCGLSDSGTIDNATLKAFTDNWLWEGRAGTNGADFNGSGRVDFVDYTHLALRWLEGCP